MAAARQNLCRSAGYRVRGPPRFSRYAPPLLGICGYEFLSVMSGFFPGLRTLPRQATRLIRHRTAFHPALTPVRNLLPYRCIFQLIEIQKPPISFSPPPIQEAARVPFSGCKTGYLLGLPVPSPMQAQSFLHGCRHEMRGINYQGGYKPCFWVYATLPQFG